MALKNSKTGSLPVSEIYNFMTEHFPYFKVSSRGRGEPLPPCAAAEGVGGGIQAVKRDNFLSRLTSNQLHALYLHDHKLPRILGLGRHMNVIPGNISHKKV